MIIDDLFERKYTKPKLIEQLRDLSNNPNYFITFTDINKVGINPSTQWSDPIGVYTYPLIDIFPMLEEFKCPYGGTRPYCHLLEAREPVCDLQKLSLDDVFILLDELSHHIKDHDFSNSDISDPFKYWEAMFHNILRIREPDEAFWEGTRKMANFLIKTDSNKSIPVTWNKILRSTGHNIFLDRNSIISANEPEQAVFLHPLSYNVNNTFINDIFNL